LFWIFGFSLFGFLAFCLSRFLAFSLFDFSAFLHFGVLELWHYDFWAGAIRDIKHANKQTNKQTTNATKLGRPSPGVEGNSRVESTVSVNYVIRIGIVNCQPGRL